MNQSLVARVSADGISLKVCLDLLRVSFDCEDQHRGLVVSHLLTSFCLLLLVLFCYEICKFIIMCVSTVTIFLSFSLLNNRTTRANAQVC